MYQKQISGTTLTVTNEDNAKSMDMAPVKIKGGCSINKDLRLGGNLYINNVKVDPTISSVPSSSNSSHSYYGNENIIPQSDDLNLGHADLPWKNVFCNNLNCDSLQNQLFLGTDKHYIDIDLAFRSIEDAVACEDCEISKTPEILDTLSGTEKLAIYLEMKDSLWQNLEENDQIEIKGTLDSLNGSHKLKPVGSGYLVFSSLDLPVVISIDDTFLVPDIGQVRLIHKNKITLQTQQTPLVLNNNLTIDDDCSTFQQKVNFNQTITLLEPIQLYSNLIQFNDSNDMNNVGQIKWNHDQGFSLNSDIHIDGCLTVRDSVQTVNVRGPNTDLSANTMIIELRLIEQSTGVINESGAKPGQIVKIVVVDQEENNPTYLLKIENMLVGSGIIFSKISQNVQLMLSSQRKWIYLDGSERHYDIVHG